MSGSGSKAALKAARETVNQIRLYWAISPDGSVHGPTTEIPARPADWVIFGVKPHYIKIHIDGAPEEWDAP